MEWILTVGVFIVAMGLCHLAMMWMMGGHGHGDHPESQSDTRVAELEQELNALRGGRADQDAPPVNEPDGHNGDILSGDRDRRYFSPFDGTRQAS